MTLFCRIIFSAACLALPWNPLRAAATNDAPAFQEVYDLLRANLAGANDDALNRAAVLGLIGQLSPQVTIVAEGATPATATNAATLAQTALFDGAYGYLRVGRVAPGLEEQLAGAFKKMSSTNKLKGLVLDLRFAPGQDYAAAAAVADLFLAREQPLIDWGAGVKSSREKSDAITLPVAVLVNQKTAGAAEALAGMLRLADVGLVLGTNTAGLASLSKEFALQNGQRLRVATTPIKLGQGQIMPLAGLKPDILIDVTLEEERAYYEDAFKVVAKPGRATGLAATLAGETNNAAGTNRPSRRLNEAELVRRTREGQNPDGDFTNTPPRAPEPAKPLVNDPALARAIDLLKGLAVVQQFRSI